MKAIIPVNRQQRRQLERSARQHVAEAMTDYKTLITYRVVGMLCIALSKYPGDPWGRKRLARLILGTGGVADRLETYDDITDWKLCQDLRSIGLPEVAERIEEESEKWKGD